MMEVERTNERCIFFMQTQNLSYYIVIPIAKQVKILLALMETNDVQRVKDIPLLNDKVVVVPVFTEQIVSYLVTPQNSYDQSMGYFSNLINNVYGLLVHNQKQVDPVVLVNNNQTFANFINYFVGKVPSGRAQKSEVDLLKREVSVDTFSSGMMDKNVMETDIPLAYPNGEVYEEERSKGKPKTLTKTKKNNSGEPGFVSYVLLGVVIAIMSLVFIYMLI